MKQCLIFLAVILSLAIGCKTEHTSSVQTTPKYYTETEVSIKPDSVTLYGTLETPANTTQQPPIVLIIPGSGNVDRNGNTPQLKMNIYKILADSLAHNGIASLRYDKRAIGKSTVKNFDESKLTFDTYVNDAISWIKWIKAQHQFSKIVIIGHSQGSLIGILAAEKEPVDIFISLEGAGRPIDTILKEQLSAQPKFIKEYAFPIIDSLKQGKKVTNVPRILYGLFRPGVQPFLISWMRYNPAKEIAKLNIPILIIQGSTDIQVSQQDAKILAKANPGSKLVIIKGMNHILRKAPADRAANIKTYTKPDIPIMSEAVQAIVQFIKQN